MPPEVPQQHRPESLPFKGSGPRQIKLCKRGQGCRKNDPDRELEYFGRTQMRRAS